MFYYDVTFGVVYIMILCYRLAPCEKECLTIGVVLEVDDRLAIEVGKS